VGQFSRIARLNLQPLHEGEAASGLPHATPGLRLTFFAILWPYGRRPPSATGGSAFVFGRRIPGRTFTQAVQRDRTCAPRRLTRYTLFFIRCVEWWSRPSCDLVSASALAYGWGRRQVRRAAEAAAGCRSRHAFPEASVLGFLSRPRASPGWAAVRCGARNYGSEGYARKRS